MPDNDKKLNIIVNLVNKTEAKFKRIDDDVKAVEKSIEHTTAAMRRIGTVATAAFTGLAFLTKKTVDESVDLGESINAVNVVFGESADIIKSFGETAANQVGLANSEFNQLAVSTGALLKNTGIPMDEVADKTIELTKRAADMASVYNTDVTSALTAINQALRGETEGIRRYAGEVTDAELQTFALAQGIDKAVTSMSQAEKRLLRVEKVMSDTSDTSGDFQNTIGSLANQSRILAATQVDLQAKIGKQLEPVVRRLQAVMFVTIDAVSKWVDKNPVLAGTLVKIGLVVSGLLATLLPLSFAIGSIVRLTKSAITPFILLSKAFKGLTTAATFSKAALIGLRGALISTGIGALVVGLGFAIAKFTELAERVGGFGNAFKIVFGKIKIIWNQFLLGFATGLDKVTSWIPGLKKVGEQTIAGLEMRLQESNDSYVSLQQEISNSMSKSEDSIADVIGAQADLTTASDESAAAQKKQAEKVEEYFSKVVDAIQEITSEIEDSLKDAQKTITDFEESLLDEQGSHEESAANLVADAMEKRKELRAELSKANKEKDSDEVASLQESIKEQEDIIKSYKNSTLQLDAEIAERRAFLNMNEFEQLQATHEKKVLLMKEEFAEELRLKVERITSLIDEKEQALSLFDEETQAKIKSEAAKTESVREQLSEQQVLLRSWATQAKKIYKEVQDAAAGVSQASEPLGPVQPSSSQNSRSFNLFNPTSRLFSPSDTSGSNQLFSPVSSGFRQANSTPATVVNNFSGNTFTDDRLAQDVTDRITQSLRRQTRMSIT